MQIVQISTSKLIEYTNNPRVNDHAVDKAAAAIKEFGFRVPILAKKDGLIVDGHLRLKAAKKLGLKDVPVIYCDDMTDTQIKAFRLSVNKIADLADWDDELLKIELEDLKVEGFDLELTGFDMDEIKGLLQEFSPGKEEDQGKLDELQPKMIICPKCGASFDARKQQS